jgi:hypothetical protein
MAIWRSCTATDRVLPNNRPQRKPKKFRPKKRKKGKRKGPRLSRAADVRIRSKEQGARNKKQETREEARRPYQLLPRGYGRSGHQISVEEWMTRNRMCNQNYPATIRPCALNIEWAVLLGARSLSLGAICAKTGLFGLMRGAGGAQVPMRGHVTAAWLGAATLLQQAAAPLAPPPPAPPVRRVRFSRQWFRSSFFARRQSFSARFVLDFVSAVSGVNNGSCTRPDTPNN